MPEKQSLLSRTPPLVDAPPRPSANAATDGIQLLRCSASREEYCLDMAEVRGIQRLEMVRQGLDDGDSIGKMTWWGEEISVFRLEKLLGDSPLLASDGEYVYNPRGPVLVLGSGDMTFAVQVDRVFHPSATSFEVIAALPKPVQGDAWRCLGVARIDGTLTVCLAAGILHPNPKFRWRTSRQVAAESAPQVQGHYGNSANKMLCFAAGYSAQDVETLCGISYSQIIEVAQDLKLVRVPGLGEGHQLLGITDWRGSAIPVANLRTCLNLRRGPSSAGRLFAIARGVLKTDLIALPVSDFSTVTFPLNNATVRVAPVDPDSLVRAAFVFGGAARRLVIPDFDPLLAA